jgi:hypothetical protein
VNVAVADTEVLRGFLLDSTHAQTNEIGAPADITERRLEEIRDADNQTLVVMAVQMPHRSLMDLQDQIARVPGLRCHGASASATPVRDRMIRSRGPYDDSG